MPKTPRLLDRIMPAALMSGGVALLMAGLLSIAPPTSLGEEGTPEPTFVAGNPVFTPSTTDEQLDSPSPPPFLPSPSPSPTEAPSPTPASPEPSPEPSPTPDPDVRASRVRIPSLRIDLPVVPGDLEVRGNRNFYPLCDVAQYIMELVQPGQEGTTYIYAHAQRGMFLPMLKASWRNNGKEMEGALVEVYTTDSQLHLYEIFRVKRHATDLSIAFNVEPGEQRLVLQTSEGPEGVIPKLQVAARPIGVVPADPAEAMPEARPRACPPR
jgi:hypothetical protein